MKASLSSAPRQHEGHAGPPGAAPVTPRRRPWLGGVAALNALAAWAGAVGLITGVMDFGETNNSRLPFDSLALAGLALAAIVAIPLSLLARSAWTGGARVDELACGVGLLLIGWIGLQIVVLWAFSLFQPLYLGLGAAFVIVSRQVRPGPQLRGALLIGLGAVIAGTGLGLVPHVVEDRVSVMALWSVVAVLAGVGLLAVGAATALRGVRRLNQIAGVVAVVAAVALVLSVVAPAVAATNVPASDVTVTPADLGLDFEAVTLRTSDGVLLGAWYLRGSNGAGLVVLHGAGSTRSDVLVQARVLVEGGYAVLLVDGRGHGESGGKAMDFGWYGDLDVAAGTGFLASRPEIEPGRVGVVGFSMGGEEAIGAAAGDRRIAVVVAEGATARQAADKAWLSEVYGWRGQVQERVEQLQYGITDYLTDASPPTALRAAVRRATDTRFLLITAGEVADEGHAAAYLRSAAEERIEVWTVEGAGHTGGYAARPDEWRRRVLAFLDANLT